MEALTLIALVVAHRAPDPQPLRIMFTTHETRSEVSRRTGKNSAAYWSEWAKFAQDLGQAGVLEDGNALAPQSPGAIISAQSKKAITFSKVIAGENRFFSGYFVLKVSKFSEAEKWARKCPAVLHGGAVELRLMMPKMEVNS